MRKLSLQENILDNAEKEARKRNLYDFPIVDADCHYLYTPLEELSDFVEEPWRRRFREREHGTRSSHTLLPVDLGDRTVEGRMKTMQLFMRQPKPEGEVLPRVIYPLVDSSRKMGIDYSVVFPTDMLTLGLTPRSDFEVAFAYAYARWMTEKILPFDDSLLTMLYLPLSNPEASIQIVKEFGDRKGVVGGLVTSVRDQPIHHNDFMPLFRLLEERELVLGFHTVSHWQEHVFRQFNRFLSAHALGFPFYNMVQMTNLIVNGIPERFPGLKVLFIEAGVAWIPFMAYRLDNEYMLRPSEAPLLRKRPSEYMRNFYFTSQPLEMPANPSELEWLFRTFDAESHLLYASDYPHQDFDTPASIYDLPFLSEQAKRKILGENALKLFRIDHPVLHARERAERMSGH